MKRKHKRMMILGLGGLGLAAAAALVLLAFEDNIVFFLSPTDLVERQITQDRRLRVGGLVEKGSVMKTADGVTIEFKVTDLKHTIPVRFRGILPDLFREGQGLVAEGHFRDPVFVASEVLAKLDETYLPTEVADALKKSGKWKGGQPLPDTRPQGQNRP